jgi:hypothetical protein
MGRGRIAVPFLMLFALAATASSAFAASVEISDSEGAALILIEKKGKGCAFRFHFPAQNRINDWFDLPGCLSATENLIFDPDKKRALVLRAGKYWSVDIKQNAKPSIFADAYPVEMKKSLLSTKTWFDRRNGTLRVAYLIELPTDSAGDPTGDWVRKTLPNLAKPWSKNGVAAGVPAAAVVAELQRDGSWKQLAVKLTGAEADGALGLDAVNSFISPQPRVVSLLDLLMAATCHAQACENNPISLGKASASWARKVFGTSSQPDEVTFNYVAFGKRDGLLGRVVFGDSYHWNTPIFYCTGGLEERCASHRELIFQRSPVNVFESQKGISIRSGYALITQEYEGTVAYLYKSGSGKPIKIYTDDTIVAWMPFTPW